MCWFSNPCFEKLPRHTSVCLTIHWMSIVVAKHQYCVVVGPYLPHSIGDKHPDVRLGLFLKAGFWKFAVIINFVRCLYSQNILDAFITISTSQKIYVRKNNTVPIGPNFLSLKLFFYQSVFRTAAVSSRRKFISWTSIRRIFQTRKVLLCRRFLHN